MKELTMGMLETKFADIIWENEPVLSGELSALAEKELKWKKPTSFTVLRRLCDKGIFVNKKGVVTSLMSKTEYNALRSEQFIEGNFGGSLPAFVAAFTSRKGLKPAEIEELRNLIEEYEEE